MIDCIKILDVYPKKSKILIIGPYPPPLGGVSVHVKRLRNSLAKKGYDVEFFDTNTRSESKVKRISKIIKFSKLIKIIILKQYNIVHIQYLYRGYIFVIPILKKLKGFQLYYTDHNPRLFDNLNRVSFYTKKRFVEKLDYLIVVADHILEKYKKKNVRLPTNFLVKNAFLPPPLEEKERIYREYSNHTKSFISKCNPLILANATKLIFFRNIDLYGLDLCIELTYRLKKIHPEIGFLFALANKNSNSNYFSKMNSMISDLGINENFHFMIGQKELWPLLKIADLSVRPTVTDGDSISIRESLYFNCPVIASDIVDRPEGTIIFKSRNIDDLYLKTVKILNQSNNSFRNKSSEK